MRLEVARLPRPTKRPQPLWLWWHDCRPAPEGAVDAMLPDLDRVWHAYVRRFALEHTFRFLKQTRNWTTPRLRYPEQADRWTWLVLVAST